MYSQLKSPELREILDRLKAKRFIGFDGEGEGGEGNDNPLDGLSEEDLSALEELDDAGLTPEQIKTLHDMPKPDEKDQAIEGLRATLRKERNQRRQFERELKALKAKGGKPSKPQQGTKTKSSETEEEEEGSAETAEEVQRERLKSERLAASFATNAVNTTILRVVSSGGKGVPKFKDTDDVLSLIKRDEIDVEQNEDDPAQVTVDEDDVKSALKDLAKRKPHLLQEQNNNEGGAGGSKFGGGNKTGSEKDRKTALKDKYPALNRR